MKLFSKILCMALAATTIVSFSATSAFASEANRDVSVTEKRFTPSDNSTWGDLYRYFDPEGFSALSPEEKYFYNSVPLNNDDTTSPALANNSTTSSVAAFMAEHGKTDYISTSGTIQPIENDDEQNRAIDLGISTFTLGLDSTTDSIGYTGLLISTISCPKLGIAVTLYDENGTYVDFNSESEDNAIACSIDDRFEGLESKTTYTVHALALITPPENYVASPLYLQEDYTTK